MQSHSATSTPSRPTARHGSRPRARYSLALSWCDGLMDGFGLGLARWRNWLGFVRLWIGRRGRNWGLQRFDNDRAKRFADLHSSSPIWLLSSLPASPEQIS